MKRNGLSTLGAGLLASTIMLASGSVSVAQSLIDEDAGSILSAMSTYLGGLEAFSVDVETSFEIVDLEGQKLQAIGSGSLAIERPGKVHMTRKGSVMDVELFLSDGALTILGKNLNSYLQVPDQATIEQAVDTLRSDLGFPAPGADFATNNPAARLLTEGTRGVHVGMTTVGGQPAHHLAFRNDLVDWQIWVTDSESPVPLRYVVTNKWVVGGPQYTLQLRNWNVAPNLGADAFTFAAPAGSQELEVVTVNIFGELVAGEE